MVANFFVKFVEVVFYSSPCKQDGKTQRCVYVRAQASDWNWQRDGLRLTGVGRAPHSITQMTTTSGLEILRQQLQHLLAHAPQKLCTPRRALVIAHESGLVANVQ